MARSYRERGPGGPKLSRVDPFTWIVVGGLSAFVLVLLAIGKWYPGSGADVLDWKPTRSPEVEFQNELDDTEQMIAAQNALRAKRGLPPRTEQDVELDVAADEAALREISDRYFREHGGGAERPAPRDDG
jgi:hypothetical protein